MLRFLYCFLGLSLLSFSGAQAQKPSLTIYTYDSFTAEWGAGPPIEAAFEKTCNCDVRFVGIDSSLAILSRLRLEGENSPADIILGLDSNSIVAAKATGLLAEHGIARDIIQQLTLPIDWHDEMFLPFDYGYFAFIYDRRRTPKPPTSLHQLTDNPQKLKLVIQDARFSTPGLGLMLWMRHVFGDQAGQRWQALAPHIIAAPPSWSSAYNMFLQGEADMVLSYTTSPAYHKTIEGDDHYAAAAFSEGHYLQIEVAAMTKKGDSQLARDFLHFMLSDGFQNHIADKNWMYPLRSVPVPKAFQSLIVPTKTLFFPIGSVEEQHSGWLKQWQAALTR